MSETLFGFRWKIADDCDAESVEKIASRFRVHPSIAQMLLKRVSADDVKIGRFLSANLKDLSEPFQLRGLKKATERLVKAVNEGERIMIHGDYDADGITSAALLYLFLKGLGLKPLVFIPNRLKEGHGISQEACETAKTGKCTLLITCDVGISSFDEVAAFKSAGIDVIITDHHESGDTLPCADAVFDPVNSSDTELKYLAGVGVVFYLAISARSELREQGFFNDRPEPDLREHLDLVAVGTVADVSPMLGENRILVKYGTAKLGQSSKPGLASLLEVSGLGGVRKISEHEIAFRIAPRINAAGRLGHSDEALELLITGDALRARELAAKLERYNIERKKIEEVMLREAASIIESAQNWEDKKVFCLARRGWHRGLIGLIANKLSDRYGITSAMIAVNEGECRGSVRSISPVNVVETLKDCSQYLKNFGGHALAGGFSIDEEKIPSFCEKFAQKVNEQITSAEYGRRELAIDAKLRIEDVDDNFIEALEKLEPYGPMNTEPTFISREVEIINCKDFGANHSRVIIRRDGLNFIEGVCFSSRIGKETVFPRKADVVFTPEFNFFNGKKTARLIVKDLKLEG